MAAGIQPARALELLEAALEHPITNRYPAVGKGSTGFHKIKETECALQMKAYEFADVHH